MNEHFGSCKVVHVFRNGRSRAVRIPKEFEFEGDEVEMQRNVDGTLTLKPVSRRKSWAEVFDAMEPLGPDDAFPEIDDPAPEAVELAWDEGT